jgi:hypothetical protein
MEHLIIKKQLGGTVPLEACLLALKSRAKLD